MARTPEGAVKEQCVAVFKEFEAYYFFTATHGYGRSGVPDIVGCLDGYFLAVECKAGKNVLQPLQRREIAAIKATNSIALVIREDNIHVLRQVLEVIVKLRDLAARYSIVQLVAKIIQGNEA